jgi:hypothetical protein
MRRTGLMSEDVALGWEVELREVELRVLDAALIVGVEEMVVAFGRRNGRGQKILLQITLKTMVSFGDVIRECEIRRTGVRLEVGWGLGVEEGRFAFVTEERVMRHRKMREESMVWRDVVISVKGKTEVIEGD